MTREEMKNYDMICHRCGGHATAWDLYRRYLEGYYVDIPLCPICREKERTGLSHVDENGAWVLDDKSEEWYIDKCTKNEAIQLQKEASRIRESFKFKW